MMVKIEICDLANTKLQTCIDENIKETILGIKACPINSVS